MATDRPASHRKKTILFIIITSLFFFWGMANNMTDTLLSAFKHILEMTDTQTSFIQFAFYAAYFCFALPAAYLIKCYGYKNGMIFGLLFYAMGSMLFFPAAGFSSYAFYLIAIYIMAGGCSILETVANPYILSMETDSVKALRKLNLAQAFNPVGSISGILMSKFFILDNLQDHSNPNPEIIREELDSVTIVYAGVGEVMLVVMVLLLFMNVPNFSNGFADMPFVKSAKLLFSKRNFRFGLVAEFFYVGAQIGVWSFIVKTVQEINADCEPSKIYLMAFVSFTFARFFFTYLMKYFQPHILLLIAGISALILSFVVMFGDGISVLIALSAISFCMSLMFPTIFGTALENTGNNRQLGASMLIMSIIGGSFFPSIQSVIAEKLTFQFSYIVPAVCFAVVTAYSISLTSLWKMETKN